MLSGAPVAVGPPTVSLPPTGNGAVPGTPDGRGKPVGKPLGNDLPLYGPWPMCACCGMAKAAGKTAAKSAMFRYTIATVFYLVRRVKVSWVLGFCRQ